MTKLEWIRDILDQAKAEDITVLDVRALTTIADTMVVASGTSTRHVSSIARRLDDEMRSRGYRAQGVEGADTGEWVLVDLSDVIVHVMHPKTRAFYALEKLWSEEFGRTDETRREALPGS
ncbi:MAG: ribosome silencing factor [Gammaproteobacteria bacterium]|nr:ribosome silencing factor [Gammaproteobacteria bacterium]